MPNEVDVINSKLASLHAQMLLAQGVVQHPAASQLDYLGIPVRPGMVFIDSVTGQKVTVISGGVQTIDPAIAIESDNSVGGS